MRYKRYNANNKNSSLNNFEDRKSYKEELEDKFPAKGMDLWEESYYYTRLNDAGDSIFVSEGFLKPIGTGLKEIYAVNFVADAFLEWKTYYETLLKKKGRGELLKSLEPIKSWISVHDLYHSYILDKFSRFLQYSKGPQFNRKELCDFKGFVKGFIKFNEVDKEFPMCRSTFITSKYCNPYISGMLIDLKGIPQDADFQKQRIIFDDDFEIYNKSLNKYGFRVNFNAPWVIVSDIKSKNTKKYIANYTDKNVWDELFFKAYESDIDVMKRYLAYFFNSYVISTKPNYSEADIMKPEDITTIDEPTWFSWYAYIKISEANYLG